jgi:hypothetical protein
MEISGVARNALARAMRCCTTAGRFNEDWSVLRGVDVWLTIGGQVRERCEFINKTDKNDDSDSYYLAIQYTL